MPEIDDEPAVRFLRYGDGGEFFYDLHRVGRLRLVGSARLLDELGLQPSAVVESRRVPARKLPGRVVLFAVVQVVGPDGAVGRSLPRVVREDHSRGAVGVGDRQVEQYFRIAEVFYFERLLELLHREIHTVPEDYADRVAAAFQRVRYVECIVLYVFGKFGLYGSQYPVAYFSAVDAKFVKSEPDDISRRRTDLLVAVELFAEVACGESRTLRIAVPREAAVETDPLADPVLELKKPDLP